jgi:osmotically-inducible protein OsmY
MERNNESRNRYNDNRNTRESDQYNNRNQDSGLQENRNQDSDRGGNQWDNNSRSRYGRNRSERRLDSMGSLGNDTNRFNDDNFGSRGSYALNRNSNYGGSYESGNYDSGQRRNYDYENREGSYDDRDGNRYDDRERNRGGSSYYNRDNDSRNWWDKTKDEVSGWFGDENAQQRRSTDQQNQHRGKGPKGYTRTDERIKEDVHERLTEDGMIDASEIEVDVKNGEIFLKGTVKNRQEKRRAEDIVEDISGVKNVENHIKVQQEGSASGYSGQSSQQYGEKKFGTNAGSGLNVGSEYTTHN